jgi:hypothetical protein
MTQRREIPWQTNANGMLINARYHDGRLLEFAATRDGQFRFGIEPEGGGWTDIELEGVGTYGFQDLTDGNIVVDVWIHRVRETEPDWEVWRVLHSHIHDRNEVRRAAEHIIQKHPDDLVFGIDTAYGGSFAAMCARVCVFTTPA